MKNKYNVVVIILTVLSGINVYAQYNHPELRWSVLETAHFRIIYHQNMEITAQNTAQIAEETYYKFKQEFNIDDFEKTDIIISNYEDVSNGLATPLGQKIFLYTQDYAKYTTGPEHWLPRVFKHEFAHIATFKKFDVFPGLYRELLSLGTMPIWFIEGIAQYMGESWDDHRDLLLKSAFRYKELFPLEKLDGFIGCDLVDARLVYEEGHSLVRYIAARYGTDKPVKILEAHKKNPLSFNQSLKNVLGKDEWKLFDEWREELIKTYTIKNNSGLKNLSIELEGVYGVRYSPEGEKIAVVGIKRFREGVSRLYLCDTTGVILEEIDGPEIGAHFSWSPDGSLIVYTKKRRGKYGSLINDLYAYDTTSQEIKRLTDNLRATDPSFSPDGNKIAFIKKTELSSGISILDVKTGDIKNITKPRQYREFFTPSWSPDGRKILFSLFDSTGTRTIASIDTDTERISRFNFSQSDDRNPVYLPNGTSYAFVSYKNGIPQLYKKTKESTLPLTSNSGGVFNPFQSKESGRIGFISINEYKKTSPFIVNSGDSSPAAPHFQNKERKWKRISPDWENNTNTARDSQKKKYAYNPLKNYAPILSLPYLTTYGKDRKYGIYNVSFDPLEKHVTEGYAVYNSGLDYDLTHIVSTFYPTIYLNISRRDIDRGNYFSTKNLYERTAKAGISFLFPFNFGENIYSNHTVFTGIVSNSRKILNQNDFITLKQSNRPWEGRVTSFFIEYFWNKYSPDVATNINPKDGFYLNFLLRKTIKGNPDYSHFLYYLEKRVSLNYSFVLSGNLGGYFYDGDIMIQNRTSIGHPYQIRGIKKSLEGTKALFGSIESRIPVTDDIGLKLPLLYFERLILCPFWDFGKAWGKTFFNSGSLGFNETDFTKTAGLELRLRLYLDGKLPIIVKGGYGINLKNIDEKNGYVLIEPDLSLLGLGKILRWKKKYFNQYLPF